MISKYKDDNLVSVYFYIYEKFEKRQSNIKSHRQTPMARIIRKTNPDLTGRSIFSFGTFLFWSTYPFVLNKEILYQSKLNIYRKIIVCLG